MSDSSAVQSSGGSTPGGEGGKRTSPITFLRQVLAELRKVVWPTQAQLATYFVVVMVFVVVVMAIISGLDLAFGKFTYWLFTGGNA